MRAVLIVAAALIAVLLIAQRSTVTAEPCADACEKAYAACSKACKQTDTDCFTKCINEKGSCLTQCK